MQVGLRSWVSGWVGSWIGGTVLLAVVAAVVGPGPIDGPKHPVVMIHIEGGSFPMGAEGDVFDERPAHLVAVKSFEMDQVPVTNTQFAQFLNARGGVDSVQGLVYDLSDRAARIWRVGERFAVEPGFEQHPVVAETWWGARAFCAWRGGAHLPVGPRPAGCNAGAVRRAAFRVRPGRQLPGRRNARRPARHGRQRLAVDGLAVSPVPLRSERRP
jgi:hypothetical protein